MHTFRNDKLLKQSRVFCPKFKEFRLSCTQFETKISKLNYYKMLVLSINAVYTFLSFYTLVVQGQKSLYKALSSIFETNVALK